MSRYIDADKLKEILFITANFADLKKVFEGYIDKTPTEDVKPIVRAEWIELGYVGNDNYNFECSECHHTDTQSKEVKVNYCWYCGAKMKGTTE